ncbi:hypothetical protein VIGAN_01173300, partial [Vigna angularis var. angularis]
RLHIRRGDPFLLLFNASWNHKILKVLSTNTHIIHVNPKEVGNSHITRPTHFGDIHISTWFPRKLSISIQKGTTRFLVFSRHLMEGGGAAPERPTQEAHSWLEGVHVNLSWNRAAATVQGTQHFDAGSLGEDGSRMCTER